MLAGKRDAEGHRTYNVIHRVECARTDGPAVVMNTPGLPLPGAMWSFMDDVDTYAWCRNDMNITMVTDRGKPCRFYDVEQVFSTKPPSSDKQRCNDTTIEDPLMEPQRVSGSFVRFTEEATVDRFGAAIDNSAFEVFRGPQVEFDANRSTVRIEQNVADLQLALLAEFMREGGTLNDSTLWGVIPRGVRLSQVSWSKKYYGACYAYYTRVLEFEINVKMNVSSYGASEGNFGALGTGYAVGDFITLAGGVNTNPCVLRVTATNSTGQIADFAIHTPGAYSVTPPNEAQQDTTTGSGSGATFNMTWTYGTTITSGWDRDLLDEATKVLNGYHHPDGYWQTMFVDEEGTIDPDPNNPAHFIRYTDRQGNPAKVILNGNGIPYDTGSLTTGTADDTPGNIHVEKYPQGNLLLLGIPLEL